VGGRKGLCPSCVRVSCDAQGTLAIVRGM